MTPENEREMLRLFNALALLNSKMILQLYDFYQELAVKVAEISNDDALLKRISLAEQLTAHLKSAMKAIENVERGRAPETKQDK